MRAANREMESWARLRVDPMESKRAAMVLIPRASSNPEIVPVVLHEIPSPSQAKEVELEDDRNRDVNPLQRLAYLYDTAWIPHASMSTITHETDLWVEAHRLTETAKCRERYQLIDCGMCASYFYRYARETIVRSASDIIAWLFIFDDYFGEGEQIGSRVDLQDYCYSFKSVIEGEDSCALSGSFHRGLADFCSRMAAVFGSGWRTAFWESFEAYFTGCLAEYDYRRQGLVPTYDEYRRYRKNSIGVLPIFEIIDAPSSFLDPEIRREPVFRALREQAAILCSQCNDIASYEKECRDGDPNNIIKVVQSHFGLTEEGAIERCVAIHAQDLELFDDLVAKIMAGPDYEPIRRYAKGLRDLVTGCYAFHQRSRRYKRESFHLIRLPQVEIDGVKEAIASVRERSDF